MFNIESIRGHGVSEYICRVIIEPQEEGGFTAYVPSLPGCVSQGPTYQETLDNIREALELCPEATKERNDRSGKNPHRRL